jgi:hypothetical protein
MAGQDNPVRAKLYYKKKGKSNGKIQLLLKIILLELS